MTRPRKLTQHCRRISTLRFQPTEAISVSSDSDDPTDDNDDVAVDVDFPSEPPMLRTVEEALHWVEEAYCRSRAPHIGNSDRTLFRKQAEKKRRLDLAEKNMKITTFFTPEHLLSSEPESQRTNPGFSDGMVQVASSKLSVEEAIQELRLKTQNTPNIIQQRHLQQSTNEWRFMCLLAIRQYFQRIRQETGKLRISEEIAKFLFPDKSPVHQGRLIRIWADHYLHFGDMPERQQGLHVKVRSLIHDDDVQRILRTYIRSESENALTSCSLSQWVKDNLHQKTNLAFPVTISEKTSQRWLKILGLTYGRYRPGLYNDGHERPDVVRYRESFLQRFERYEQLMIQYEGEFMEKVIAPPLAPTERPLVLVTHDESSFSSHDGRDIVWLDDDNHPIRPKGDGRSIMVSAFLCECHGLLRLSEEQQSSHPGVPTDATVTIKPGANAEGYWRNADLVKQLKEKAFPIFKVLHPDCDGLFMFDNSQNHHAKPPDALSVSVLNLKDGGKNARAMRDGWFNDSNGQRVVQILYSEGILKGAKSILTERDLWPAEGLSRDAARKLLSSQSDFLGQREWLEETVTEAGFLIDFYPKYHCEFNYIEMFWGAAKAYARKHCTYEFNHLVQTVPLALDSVSLSMIRKFARKSYRYIDAYRVRDSDNNSLTTKQIEYAVKKYRQHRKIPMRVLDSLE